MTPLENEPRTNTKPPCACDLFARFHTRVYLYTHTSVKHAANSVGRTFRRARGRFIGVLLFQKRSRGKSGTKKGRLQKRRNRREVAAKASVAKEIRVALASGFRAIKIEIEKNF